MRTARIVIVAALSASTFACTANTASVSQVGLSSDAGLATGARIYAVNESDSVVTAYKVLANGDVAPSAHIGGGNTGLSSPFNDAFDASSQLYVLQQTNYVVFAAGAHGNATPKWNVGGAFTQISNPQGIAVDPTGIVYITDATGGPSYITVYAAGSNGNRAPQQTIYDGQDFFFIPSGIAVFNGTLYVADQGDVSINEYLASSNGIVNPAAVIEGSSTGLNTPRGVAVDSRGRIYVTDNDRVLVFAASANGNVAPIRTIAGSNTQLNGAVGLTIHSTGIFVANSGGAITVYPLSGNGNIAPVRVISGSLTQLDNPQDVAIP